MATKFTERVPLEGSVDMKVAAFIDVEADSFDELINAVDEVKNAYAQRLHVAPGSTQATIHGEDTPEPLSERVKTWKKPKYNSNGTANYDPMADGLGIPETCDTCGAAMELKWKESKNKTNPDGSPKQYQAYFCPNWKFGTKGHNMKFPKG